MSVEKAIQLYYKTGFTFLYARKFHAAMRFAAPSRAALGFRTVFNVIGPLSNPAYATHQIIGVFDKDMTEKIAEALIILGIKRAMVVSAFNGLDEISLSCPTKITEIKDGWLKSYIFNPEDIGLSYAKHEDLVGGDAEVNKNITLSILKGEDGPKTDLALLNCGAALYVYGIAESIKEGYEIGKTATKSGKSFEFLNKIIKEG